MAAIYLKKVPEKTLKFILKVQGDTKSQKCISQYSLERTVYQIIDEFQKLTSKDGSSKV